MFGAPLRFERNCVAGGEYGHLRRFCVTIHRPNSIQPHTNVVTASGGDSGNPSWDHNDGGSRGVAWADQQTSGLPSGGRDHVGEASTQLGVGGDRYGGNGRGGGGCTE